MASIQDSEIFESYIVEFTFFFWKKRERELAFYCHYLCTSHFIPPVLWLLKVEYVYVDIVTILWNVCHLFGSRFGRSRLYNRALSNLFTVRDLPSLTPSYWQCLFLIDLWWKERMKLLDRKSVV